MPLDWSQVAHISLHCAGVTLLTLPALLEGLPCGPRMLEWTTGCAVADFDELNKEPTGAQERFLNPVRQDCSIRGHA